eukprot:jgi/Psemu1/46208/gm1.46208_g
MLEHITDGGGTTICQITKNEKGCGKFHRGTPTTIESSVTFYLTNSSNNNNNNSNHNGGQAGGNPGNRDSDRQPRYCKWTKGNNNNPRQDQVDMKGVVMDRSIDHRIPPVSQQFDTFYKTMKIVAGKTNPDLAKPGVRTLIGLTITNYTKEMYSRLWLEEKKERSKDKKKYELDLKILSIPGFYHEKKFVDTYQDASKDLAQYVEEVQMKFDVMKAAGISLQSDELTNYTMKQVFPSQDCSTYVGMNKEAKKPIKETVEQLLVATQIVEGSNKKNHRNIPGMLQDEYALKKDAYPTTPSEALELLMQFKASKTNTKPASTVGNNNNGNNQARGDNKNSIKQTIKSTAFVTNGEQEVSKNNVQEVHQPLMNGIADGESFGEELHFVQSSNIKHVQHHCPNWIDNGDNCTSDEESSTRSVPEFVKRTTDGYSACSDASIASLDMEMPATEPSTKPRSGEQKNSRSGGNMHAEHMISKGTEFLLAQNNGKLDLYSLLLDSQAASWQPPWLENSPDFGLHAFYVHKGYVSAQQFTRADNNLYVCDLKEQHESLFTITTDEGKKELYSNLDIKRADNVTQTRFGVLLESRAYLGRTPLGKEEGYQEAETPLFTARQRKKTGVVVSPGLRDHILNDASCYSYFKQSSGLVDFASCIFIRKSKKLEDATQQLGLTNTRNGPQSSDGALPEVLDNQVMYDPSVEPIGRALIGQELTNIEDDDDSVSDDNFFFPNDDDEEEGSESIEAPHSLSVNDDEEDNNIDVDDSHCDSNTTITTPNVGRNISDELKVKIKLMKIMQNHSIPLVAEKELYEWAIESERLNLFSWTKGNLIKTRASVMKEISATVPEIKGDGFEPHLIDWCSKKSQSADVSSRKQIYVRLFQKALHSLLTNVTLVKEANLSFPHAEDPTLPVCYPELQGNIDIDDLHHGEWWINTWEKRCKSKSNEILVPIILYMDGIAIDNSGQTTLTPLNMTLGIFNTLTRNSRPDAWEAIYFHPTGSRDKGAESIDNVNNLHSGLRLALSSLKDACNQTDGIEWSNLPWNKKKWLIRMKFAVAYFIGDTPQHGQLCGHYQTSNSKMICRHCNCPRALGINARVNVLKVPVSLKSGNMQVSKHQNGDEYKSIRLWNISDFTAPTVDKGVNVEQYFKNISHHG